MCEAIMEIAMEKMKDKLDDAKLNGIKEGRKEGRREEASLNAIEFFKNGVSFELVEKSISSLTHEELMKIYHQVSIN